METGNHFLYNGKFYKTGKLIISADNRSFRFGDGLFETMLMHNENIPLLKYHFERLFTSLHLLKFELPGYFTALYLSEQIKKTAQKNQHEKLARIRVTVFRGDGSLYEYENNFPNYIIQTWQPQADVLKYNKKGLAIDVYTKARKTCDDFSHIKSNNYLPYLMAALWAKENKLDDAIILNTYNRIADATIANIFLVKDGKIKTPALSEGCVSGVMRKFLLQLLLKENIPYEETKIYTDEIAEADELFLTNAVSGMRWIRQCGNHHYKNALVMFLYKQAEYFFKAQ